VTRPETRSSSPSKVASGIEQPFIKILRHLSQLTCALAIVALAVNGAFADTPASQVSVQTVQPTQSYPEVSANGEGWFDVGGFCKVVDVGDLSAMSPPATGVPVFVPGPTDQWENYRTSAPSDSNYKGRLTLTTCCRPQAGMAELCTEAGATPVAVSRQYGKLNEVDTVSATCVDQWGKTYQDQINVACSGDNGPDGQAQWAESGADATSACTANAFTSACTVSCGGGTQTTYDSCGNVQAVAACNTQACCTTNYVKTGCSGTTATYTDEGTCHSGSHTVAGGCVAIAESCSGQCTDVTYESGGCTYTDCQNNWPCQGDPGCTFSGADIETDYCNGNYITVDAGVNYVSCSWTEYE